ncbi:hypothetical protein Q6A26_10400, partial [Xanthomonas euvesicatoria pv. eucalypti]|uniref:AsmA-like C-terminal region-containing protein n=1 Tax=Xanthomonas euvesicatoria TaxID=456327 RepID=UPI0026E26C02
VFAAPGIAGGIDGGYRRRPPVGGRGGAAVGAAANAVLGKPLGAIGAKTYHVTGPWKDPQVDVVEREARERAPSKPAAPSGRSGKADPTQR